MIVVRVELWSAITGEKTELARMAITNDETGTMKRRNYLGRVFRGRNTEALNKRWVHRTGNIRNWSSESVHVWNLVAAMLTGMGYGRKEGAS